MFKDTVLDVWDSEKHKSLQSNIDHSKKAVAIEMEKQNILRMLKDIESDIVRKDLEKEYESLCFNIALEIDLRDNQKQTELDLEIVINKAGYFLEHPYEFIAATNAPLEKEQLFSLFFYKFPSYDELVNGTPSLSCVFELSRNQSVSKDQLVTLR